MKKFLSVLLAVMMVLSTVSFAAPSAVATMDSDVELPVVDETVAEDTADLAADGEISEDVDSYGEMIFELNFDSLDSITSNEIKFRNIGWINPEFEYTHDYLTEKANINFAAYPTYSLKERASGDKYLELSGGTGYAVTLLQSGTDRAFQGEAGVYTLTADVYRPDGMPITTRFSGPSTEDTPIQDFSDLNAEGWGKMILQHDPSCFGNGGHAVKFESVAQVKTIKFHRNGGSDLKTVGYDNIRLYYKPLTVDVTVKYGDKTATKEVSTTTPVAVSDLTALLDLGVLYSATGAKIGDKTYDADDYITFGKDTTVEITAEKVDDKYVHPTHGIMLYDIDFEQVALNTEITAGSDFGVGAYATPVAAKVMSHDPTEWHLCTGHSLTDFYVYTDPVDPSNKVAGVKNYTLNGYPAIIVKTDRGSASARRGFVEDDDIVLTLEYDYYDSNAKGIALRFGGRSSRSENEGHAKWAILEDTCTEYNNGRVASAWYKNTGVYTAANASRMGGTDEISFAKMHMASPENSDVFFDNIRIYYKPAHVDVKFAESKVMGVEIANAEVKNVSSSGLKVSELLALAGVDYSAVSKLTYSFKGVSIAGNDTVYGLNDTIAFYENSTINLVFEKIDMSDWTTENGILLFDIDFNDAKAQTVFVPETGIKDFKLVDFGAKVNPYFAGSENWKLSNSGMDIIGIENGALKLQWDGTGKWPQVLIGNSANQPGNELVGEDGYYYVHAEYKVLGAVDADLASIAIQSNGFVDGEHKGPSGIYPMGNDFYTRRNDIVPDQWLIIDGGNPNGLSTGGKNDTDGIDNDDISKITTVFTYNATAASASGYYLMDNVKLYWKPASVNVTVYGGSNAGYGTQVLNKVSTASTAADLVALLPGSPYGKITSFADLEGNKITDFKLTGDTELVAVWTPWVILEGGQEFAIDAKNVNSNGTNQWSGSYGDAHEVGDGGGDITTAVRWMYGDGWISSKGNLIRTQRGNRIGDAENGKFPTATWETPGVHGHDAADRGLIRDMIHTSLPAGNDAEYVVVAYKYNNLPDLAEVYANDPNPEGYKYTLSADGNSLTYFDRYGEERTFKMAPDYGAKYYIERTSGYSYAGGEEYHKNELMVEGEWYYDFLPFDAKMNELGVKKVIIQRYNLFDGMQIEYDYARFVKIADEEEDVVLPEKPVEPGAPVKVDAPVSLEGETAMRLEEGKDNGVRFKATMNSKANDAAATIGWAVVSYDKFMANGTQSYDNLSVETEGVKIGYQRLDGEKLVNFFDESDDEALVFAATLKNIPEEHYASYFIVRPFICVEGEYLYGEAFSTSLYDIAVEIYYDDDAFFALDEEYQIYVEDIVIAVEG